MLLPFKQFIDNNFDHSKVTPVSRIPFDNEARKLCEQNSCGKFGKSWTCPPAIGTIESLRKKLDGFNRFVVFYKVYDLGNRFDWKGMINGLKDFQSRIIKLKKHIREKDVKFDFLVLGAGACQVCDVCTYPEQKPCRFPEEATFSVESYSIDVMKLMKDNGLKYYNGPNTVTYIGGLFYMGG